MVPQQEKDPDAGRVFLCHSSGDKDVVRNLYKRLLADGFNPWLDEHDILPGEDWELEITRAVRSSAVVLVCLSRSAVTKAGFVQKEIKYALDVADEQPEGAIFIIPVRLEECDVPDRLSKWQWVDWFKDDGHSRILKAVARKGLTPQPSKALNFNTIREVRTVNGHSKPVTGVAVSLDGRLAVSAPGDKTLKVWEVETGHELRTLVSHTEWVRGVAVSGDGRLAVSASNDKTVKVWDVESGHELRTLCGHSGGVFGVAMSRDGRLAVSASGDKTLKVWDVEGGRELSTLEGHTGSVMGVAMSEDGRLAVSASNDKTLKVWGVDSGRELRTLKGHSEGVYGAAMSGDGRLAVSASGDKTLKVWEVESGRELRTLTGHDVGVGGVALNGDGRLAISASWDHTLKLWEVESGTPLATFTCKGSAYCCAFINDREVIAGDDGGRTYLLSLEVWEPKD